MKHSTFIQHQAKYILCTIAMLVSFVGTAWGDERTVTINGNGHTQTVTSLTEPSDGQGILLPAGYQAGETKTTSNSKDSWTGATGNYAGNGWPERWSGSSIGAGNVLTQTLTGLDNGTYEVTLKVGASLAWIGTTPIGDNLTYAFANSTSVSVPVKLRTAVANEEVNTVVLTTTVTDGTLTYGLKNIAPSGNWYIINVVSVKKIDVTGFIGWYSDEACTNQVGNAGDTYIPTSNTTLYAKWDSHTVTAGTIGSTTTLNDNSWWSHFSPSTTIKDGETYKFSFTNHGGTDIYNNWVLIASNKAGHNGDGITGYTEHFILRADNYGWKGADTNNKFNYSKFPENTTGYFTALKNGTGTTVNMTITFKNKHLTVSVLTNGTYESEYTSDEINDDKVVVCHTVDNSYITDYTVTAPYTAYFYLNGGTGTTPTAIKTIENGLVTMPAAPSDIKMFGQTFYAWNDGNNNYNSGTTYKMGTSDVTFAAQYYLNSTKRVTFDGNGKDIAATTLREPISGQKILLPAGYSSYTDITSNSDWAFAEGVANSANYTAQNMTQFQEAYYYNPVGEGDVLTKTETGLANGTYEVIMSVAASWTRNNGIISGVTGDNLTYAFAGDKEISIPVIDRTWVTKGQENIVAFTVEVTDGTLKYGLKNTRKSGNWYLINIESFRKIDNSSFEGWYDAKTGGNLKGKAGAEYTVTGDETLYAHWKSASTSTIILEQRGVAGTAGGTFTNSTCTSNIAFPDLGGSNVISENSTYEPSTTAAYVTGGTSSITIGLSSTSASEIVIGGMSIGSAARQLSSISVDGTELTKYTISGEFPAQSSAAYGRVTIKGLKIPQGSDVTFNFSGRIRVAYFEITPSETAGKSTNANLRSVTVHGMALTPTTVKEGNIYYTYKIGTGYEGTTIDMVVTPSNNSATSDFGEGDIKTGAHTITIDCGSPEATEITPNAKEITVIAPDGEAKTKCTITVYRIPKTKTSTNRFLVSDATSMTYIEGMQCYTPDENNAIMATISTTYGYPEISGVKETNYANSVYCAYGKTEAASPATFDLTGIPTSGVYYRFDARADGYIEMGIKLNAGEQLKVVKKDGTAVDYSYKFMTSATDEITLTDGKASADATGYIQFPVVAGAQYYVYAPGSKLGFMGFYYQEKSSDATASFKLEDNPITFTNGAHEETTTKLSGEVYTVVVNPTHEKAVVTSVVNATATGNANEYKIVVPAAGSYTSAIFIITAEDGSTKSYTIRINKVLVGDSRFHLTMKTLDDNAKVPASDGTTYGTVVLNDTYATVTGGTAKLGNKATTEATLISKDGYLILNNGDQYVDIELSNYKLQEGDVIKFSPVANGNTGEICFDKSDYFTIGNQYTIPAGSPLINSDHFYVWYLNTPANIYEMEIITPSASTDVAVKINNTAVACTGGDGTSASPKVFEYEIPAEYAEDLPVSLTTTGTLNDGFTSVASANLPTYGNTATKNFSVTADGETVYYQIKLTRAVSIDCTLASATIPVTVSSEAVNITATIGDADSEGKIPVTATIPYNADGTSFNVTLKYSSTATSSWDGTSISLAKVDDVTATKEFTITAQDGVTKKTYALTLTRGTKDAYLVTENGQTLYMTEKNLSACKTTNGTFYTINTKKTTNTTYDSYEGTYYRTKNASENVIVAEKGACSFTVSMYGGSDRTANIYVGTSEDEVNKATDPTSTLTTTGSVKTSDIIKLDNTGVHYIKVAGTGSDMYLVKLTFYTKKTYTLAYSAETWDGDDNSKPTLTIKDEEGNDAPSDVKSAIVFVSDDETIASATVEGIDVIPTANGSAIITATLSDSKEYNGSSAQITIAKTQGYSYNMKDVGTIYLEIDGYKNNTPQVRQPFYFKDDDKNDLKDILVGTFGGWSLNAWDINSKDHATAYTSSNITDSWTKVGKVDDELTPIDGYTMRSTGNNNAQSESLTESKYTVTEVDADGNITTHPFSLPCRGTYMTFEPKKNGTLSIYIRQNGAFKMDDKDEPVENTFSRYAFYLTDQTGRSIADYTNFNTIVKQKISDKYYCSLDAYGNATNEDANNVGNWENFKKNFTVKEKLAIQSAWSSGPNGVEKVVVLDDGSFLVIQQACVKYTFRAIAGQTYYLFSNVSKLGFCGMSFVQDESENGTPTAELDLSENLKYDANAIANDKEAQITGVAYPQYATITLDRTFSKDYWNTLCVPFGMTEQEVKDNFGDKAEIILLDNIEVNNGVGHLHFIYHEIQAIIPGYPYIIKPSKDNPDGITVTNKMINPNTPLTIYNTTSGYASKGLDGYCDPHIITDKYDAEYPYSGYTLHLNAGDIFLKSGKMWVCGNKSYLKGYRAYLKAPAETSSQAKSVVFDYRRAWEDEDEATQIDFTEFAPEALEAFGIAPSGVYNLNGQKIADTMVGLAKGIYIVNGKKIIIK